MHSSLKFASTQQLLIHALSRVKVVVYSLAFLLKVLSVSLEVFLGDQSKNILPCQQERWSTPPWLSGT